MDLCVLQPVPRLSGAGSRSGPAPCPQLTMGASVSGSCFGSGSCAGRGALPGATPTGLRRARVRFSYSVLCAGGPVRVAGLIARVRKCAGARRESEGVRRSAATPGSAWCSSLTRRWPNRTTEESCLRGSPRQDSRSGSQAISSLQAMSGLSSVSSDFKPSSDEFKP